MLNVEYYNDFSYAAVKRKKNLKKTLNWTKMTYNYYYYFQLL